MAVDPSHCNRLTDMDLTRKYIKRKLGHPVICVEIADEQLDDVILDCVQEASRYLYGEGTSKDYVAFPLTSGTSAYQLECDISDVVSFDYMSALDGINVLHSPTHMLLYNDWVRDGNYPGGPGSYGQGSIVSYDIAMTYLKEIQNQFSVTYQAQYVEPSRTLTLLPTPREDGVGLLEVWKKTDIKYMFDHPLVKKLMIGRAMQQWGTNIGKYSITMPGGGTTNGTEIYSNGTMLEEKAFELIKTEGAFPQFWVG